MTQENSGFFPKLLSAFTGAIDAIISPECMVTPSREIAINWVVQRWNAHDRADLVTAFSQDDLRKHATLLVDQMAYIGMADSTITNPEIEADQLNKKYNEIAHALINPQSEIDRDLIDQIDDEFPALSMKLSETRFQQKNPAPL